MPQVQKCIRAAFAAEGWFSSSVSSLKGRRLLRIIPAGGVVAFPRGHLQITLGGLQRDLVEAAIVVDLVGCVGQQVLAAQLFGNQLVDGSKIVALLGFVGVTAGTLGNLRHDLFAIDGRLLCATATTLPAAAGIAAASRVSAAAG